MKKLFWLGLLGLAAGAVVLGLPDIKRYLEMSRM